MRLIDADSLSYEAELCKETTEDFIELINKQPTVIEPDILEAEITDYFKKRIDSKDPFVVCDISKDLCELVGRHFKEGTDGK